MNGVCKDAARREKLAIGAAQFGMPYGIANTNGQVREDEIEAVLDLANENGVDTLDTAKSYGNSEEAIGDYLQKRPGISWNIITKIRDGRENVIKQIHDSTKKLTRPPLAVLAHSVELYLDMKFQKELAGAKDRQIIKKTGVSLYSEDEIKQVVQSSVKTDIIQLPMNILDTRLYRRGLLAGLHDKGIEIHVRSAFLQGLFYLPESVLKSRFADVATPLNKLKSIAAKAGLTLAGLSLSWLTSLPEISKVIIGVDSKAQLKAHLETLGERVDSAVFETALSVHYENENILNPSLWPSMS